MKIRIEIQGRTYEPVVDLGKGTATINLNGRTQTYFWKYLTDNRISITPQQKTENIELDFSMLKLGKESIVKINGLPYSIKAELVSIAMPEPQTAEHVVPIAQPPPVQAPVRTGVGELITSPMPGKIVEVRVQPGAKVGSGQVLIILEAMKMQNELTAPVSGIVKEVNVSPGQSVTMGDVLAVIEPC